MIDIAVSSTKDALIPEVFNLLTQAYTPNAAHAAIFGKDNFKSNDLFFRQVMAVSNKELFIAREDGKIIGIIGVAVHPSNAGTNTEPLKLTSEAIEADESVIARLQDRQVIWGKLEPKEPHYHIGPVAVLPAYQRKGVGSILMEYVCGVIDEKPLMAYLETETSANFMFYAKFGFKSFYQTDIFNIPAYFMKRPPHAL